MDKNKRKVILVIGGDLRQTYLCNILAQKAKVYAIGCRKAELSENIITFDSVEEIPEQVDYMILPISVTNDGVNINTPFLNEKISLYSTIPYLNKNAVVFGGKIGTEGAIFTYKGFEVIDYLNREELSVMNAIPTSEGAIMLAMEEMPTTIFESNVLVTGYGRISKVLIKALKGLGAKVCVTARKYSDLEWAKINGCDSIHIEEMGSMLPEFDIIFNTVPAKIFDEKKLKMVKKDCLIIDLASKPGGVDFESATKLGIKVIWALSLPGKVAPVTAGKIIADTIIYILSERGEV